MATQAPEMFLLVDKIEAGEEHADYVHILGAFESLESLQDYLNKRGPEDFAATLFWQKWQALDSYGLHSEGAIKRKQHISYTYEVEYRG